MALNRRRIMLVAMWTSAAVAAFFIHRAQRTDAPEHAAPEAPGAPAHRATDSVNDTRGELPPPAAIEPGPPLGYRLNRRHTGRSPYRGPASARVFWQHQFGGRLLSQPAVGADGRVWATRVAFRTDGGERVPTGAILCLSSQGLPQWDRDLQGPSWFSPLLDDHGNSFVGSDGHILYALDPRGDVRFHLRVDGDVDSSAVFAPDGSIVFPAGNDLYDIAADGTIRWRFHADAKIFSVPVIDDQGAIYFGSQDDHVYGLSPEGELLFRYRTGDDVDSSLALGDDGDLYFGSDDNRVYRLGRHGELRWSTDVEGYVRAPVALGDDLVIVNVYGPRPRIVALSQTDGSLAWYFPVTVADSTEQGSRSGPIIDRDGNIYVGAHDDYLYSLTGNGELRWAFQTQGDVDSSPALAPNGMLVFGGGDGTLYALRDAD